ncbi:MAG: ATP synthase F0 subunit B, partial [Candidatus Baltobacteraceae bacterium]
MLFSIDGTFVVQLINFAIFFALLNVLFLRPVGKAVAQRRAYLDGLVGGYEKAQSEASALRREAVLVHPPHGDPLSPRPVPHVHRDGKVELGCEREVGERDLLRRELRPAGREREPHPAVFRG